MLRKILIVLFCFFGLTACTYTSYHMTAEAYRTEYGKALAVAPDGNGGIYVLTEGFGDYLFSSVKNERSAVLWDLLEQGYIRDALPGSSVYLHTVMRPRQQPTTAYLSLEFPPDLFRSGLPKGLYFPDRDYPITKNQQVAAAQRGFSLPASGRLPFAQINLGQGQKVALPDEFRASLLRQYAFYIPQFSRLQFEAMKRRPFSKSSWPRFGF